MEQGRSSIFTAWMVSLSLAKSAESNTFPGLKPIQGNLLDLPETMSEIPVLGSFRGYFLSGVKRRFNHWVDTFVMPSSLDVIFSTTSWNMIIALAITFITSCFWFLIMWGKRSIFSASVAVVRRLDLGSSLKVSLSLLNLNVHFCAVYKFRALTPNIATMPAALSLVTKLFFCRPFFQVPCQILFIFRRIPY